MSSRAAGLTVVDRQDSVSSQPRRGSLLGRVADGLTLAGVVMAPNNGVAIGGRNGLPIADIIIFLALAARGCHLLVYGLQLEVLRRQAFLLPLFAVFTVAGFISGLANGEPLAFAYLLVVTATLGATVLIATYGSDRGPGVLREPLAAFAIGGSILFISAFLGPHSREGRAIGYAIHPNALGHSCIMGSAVALWLWDNATTRRWRRIWGLAFVLNMGGILESGSRGAALAIGVAGALFLLLRGDWRTRLAVMGAVWLFVLAIATGVTQLSTSNPVQRLVVGTESTEGSDQARLQLLAQDIDNITEDPVFGLGFSQIVDVHNVYLQGWVGGGAVDGFVLMVLGMTMLLLPLWQRERDLALACGAAGIAVAWMFTNILAARDQWLFIAMTFATARALERRTT